jgi:uncharacterized protein (DUF1501 family)
MLDLLRSRRTRPKCDGTSRREFLQIGMLCMLGLTLPELLRARALASDSAGRKRSIILLFLDGGASQLETFDPKMDVPVEYRSLFGTTKTALPGVEFGGQLPKMAALADQMSIVRTFTHEDGDHGGATHWVKTGYPWPPQFLGKAPIIPQQAPSIGSVVSRFFGPTNQQTGVPTYVRVQSNHGGYPGDDAAWLGAAYSPLRAGIKRGSEMLGNMTLRVEPNRLADRTSLLASLDNLERRVDQSGMMDGLDQFRQQALDVVLGRAKEAFDLSKEDARTREKYGPGLGEELLMARRLCEAGAGFVTLNNGYWDHHGGIIPGLKQLCPPLDQAVAAYIEDVEQRGLLDEILLVVTGEFGRTPRINGGPGRDHWAPTNDIVFIGGGMKMGQIVGETDAKAAYVKSRPVTVQDYMATLLAVLGVDLEVQYTDRSGRPRSMVETGKPITELL